MPAVAADIAVPFPLSNPVILVVSVIVGVVVLVATVPVKPFALATLTSVTVPAPMLLLGVNPNAVVTSLLVNVIAP